MTRSEILKISKSILFNEEMVLAILDGRKTETRRAIKVNFREGEAGYNIIHNDTGEFCYMGVLDEWGNETRRIRKPYLSGGYMYVRETWAKQQGLYWHKAGLRLDDNGRAYGCVPPEKWHPGIHMPKEAARIFLRVTDVRAERLNNMDYMNAIYEGIEPQLEEDGYPAYNPMIDFIDLWDSTIKPKDRDKYGWAANPRVWVIQFERVMPE